MKSINYESLRVEHAWMIVSDQLQHRNNMLANGISHLERQPTGLPTASRLMMLRYHLKMSLRQLTQEVRWQARSERARGGLHQQWLHVHQLFFLLHQIDLEFGRATHEDDCLQAWASSLEGQVFRSSFMHLN